MGHDQSRSDPIREFRYNAEAACTTCSWVKALDICYNITPAYTLSVRLRGLTTCRASPCLKWPVRCKLVSDACALAALPTDREITWTSWRKRMCCAAASWCGASWRGGRGLRRSWRSGWRATYEAECASLLSCCPGLFPVPLVASAAPCLATPRHGTRTARRFSWNRVRPSS